MSAPSSSQAAELSPASSSHISARVPLTSLAAAGAALLLVALLLVGGTVYGNHLESRSIHFVTQQLAREREPEGDKPGGINHLERIKNQGMSLQSKALRQPDIVSLYGSSELRKAIPDKAAIFFAKQPTGFSVFQVGKAGATSIILLQKIVSAMPNFGPRHIAISLSSTWFLTAPLQHYYEGNFSRAQALSVAFNSKLSMGLKHDLARRMLQFPNTVQRDSLLHFALQCLASDHWWDHAFYVLLQPLGYLDNGVCAAQDRLETVIYLWEQHAERAPKPQPQRASLDWPSLLAKADRDSAPFPNTEPPGHDRDLRGDDAYLTTLAHSPEWGDLELLLRSFRELGVVPLILSMPPNGPHYRRQQISRQALNEYSRRLHALCAQYGAHIQTFDDHIDDNKFLVDTHDHMSVKGWMYYNQALNDYFHRHR